MKVEIKERALKGGNKGLYLEYYEKGFRRRENLHLYLIPDDAPNAKSINKKTYLKAMAVRSDRILNPPDFEKKSEPKDGIDRTTTWLEWCDEYIQYSIDCRNSKTMMQHKTKVCKRIHDYLDRIGKQDMLLKDVTTEVISDLYDYMRNGMITGIPSRSRPGMESWPTSRFFCSAKRSRPCSTRLYGIAGLDTTRSTG